MTFQYLNSISEPITTDQPSVGMSDEEELRRMGINLDGIGDELYVDLQELGIISDE